MKNIKVTTIKTYKDSWFSRVNWKAHLVPAAKSAYNEFCTELKALELDTPYFSLLSEDAKTGAYDQQKEEVWTDSVCIRFGKRPIPLEPVIPVKGRKRLLAETQAALVLSQSASGSVVALLYPPSSELAKPSQDFYIVGLWNNPNEASKTNIKKFLWRTLEADFYCGAANYPNKYGQKILRKLESGHKSLASGQREWWPWVLYVFRFSKGALRLFGIGWPAPPESGT